LLCTGPTVGICAIVKDDPDVLEWIDHHLRLGVSQIIILDNNSTSSLYDVSCKYHNQTTGKNDRFTGNGHYATSSCKLLPYMHSGVVEVIAFPGQGQSLQLTAYDLCLARYRDRFDFLAMLDVDEYIVIAEPSATLPGILHNFTDVGGLALSWQSFASSGHEIRPDGGVVANYFRCFPQSHSNNWHVKSIVNTKYAVHFLDPHHATYADSYFAVNSNFVKVDGPFSNPAVF